MIIPEPGKQYLNQNLNILRTNKVKDKQYFISNVSGMYAIHIQNNSGISFEGQNRFTYLREFGSGNQSEERYKNYFAKDSPGSVVGQAVSDVDGSPIGFTQKPSAKRKGYMNVMWKVISPANKIMASLLGKFEQSEYDIKANPIDANAGAEVENKMVELWALKNNIDFIRTYMSNIGITMQEPDYLPETIDELKLYKERGGFVTEDAMFIEQLIIWTSYVSSLPEIKKEVVKDLINIGIGFVKDYYDKETNTVKTRYVDPARFIIQSSKHPDFRDSEYAAEVIDMTVSELRILLAEEGVPENIYEPELSKLAKAYSGYNGNPSLSDWNKYDQSNQINGWKYDFYKVAVVDAEWIDCDGYTDIIRTNKYGNVKLIPVAQGEKVKEKENQKINTTLVRKRFKCSWIIGSDLIFNYGADNNITRPNKKDCYLSYHGYRLPFMSITDQLIPIYDHFAIAWDKYQNACATAINKGYAIDVDSLASLSSGEKNPEIEAVRRFAETGVLFFKKTDSRGNRIGNSLPIQEINGGLGTAVTDIFNQIRLCTTLIENLTGINPISMGSIDNNAPVRTSEMALQSTSDTLRPIISGWLNIKESYAKNVCLTIQLLMDYDKKAQETYSNIIGKRGIEVLKIANGNSVKYGIKLEARPTEQEKANLMRSCETALQSGRNGQPGISEADYFTITNILNYGGSLRLAEMYLESSIRRNRKEIQAIAQQNVQQQTQMQIQSAQASQQVKTQGELAIIQAKGEEERKSLAADAFFKALMAEDQNAANQRLKLMDGYLKSGVIGMFDTQPQPMQPQQTEQPQQDPTQQQVQQQPQEQLQPQV